MEEDGRGEFFEAADKYWSSMKWGNFNLRIFKQIFFQRDSTVCFITQK